MDVRPSTVSNATVARPGDLSPRSVSDSLPVWILACPRGHIVIPRFDVAALRVDLERGEVRTACKRCNASLTLSPNQLATLRHWLSAQAVADDLGK
jgi:hypothetical protein